MDIHRCRFVPYRPQSINTLAFSHSSNPKQKPPQDLRLALGRENGDIEVWNPESGTWLQEKILRGSRDRTVEQLAWTQDLEVNEEGSETRFDDGPLRLFSTGGSSSITEWDLGTGQQKRHAQGNLADIWCFAAQPQWRRNTKELELKKIAAAPAQLLVAGCSDGSIVLFSTADDSLQYVRPLVAASGKKTKVISIAWRDRNTVVAGYEHGTVQVIDVPTRTISRSMSLGKSIDGTASVVWTLKCLADGTILSGDSSGELKIWDSKTLSLTQRLKAHDADILDIATSTNGNLIFTAGVDRRVSVFKQQNPASSKKERWQKLTHRRFHQHDVKALASFEAKGFSVLVSGGMDTVPIVMPLRNWDVEYHRSLSHLPQNPQMSCSANSRLMLTWWDRELLVWNLPRTSTTNTTEMAPVDGLNHQLLTRIELQADENITSAQISANGGMIVAATAAGVKLFQIRKRIEAGEIEVRTRPVDLPTSLKTFGASIVGFSPDSKWLFVVRTSNIIAMVKITPGISSRDRPQLYHQAVKLARSSTRTNQDGSNRLGKYSNSINIISFSTDSRILATGDLSGAIDTWMLEGHEDLNEVTDKGDTLSDTSSESDSDSDSDDESDSRVIHGQKWTRNSSGSRLPQLDSAILALAFKPSSISSSQSSTSALGLHATRHNPHPVSHELPPSDTRLVAITASHQVIEFDVLQGRLSDWSRRNPSSHLPQSFTQIKDRAMGAFWDCMSSSQQERLWLYGPTWLFMLDMSRDLRLVDAKDKIGQIGEYDVREPVSDSQALKRTAENDLTTALHRKRKRNTGAGDQKKQNPFTRLDHSPNKHGRMEIDTGLLSPTSDDEHDEDEMQIDDTSALTQLRRGVEQAVKAHPDGDLDPANTSDNPHIDSTQPTLQPQSPPHHLITRYRSIFGITALERLPFTSQTQTESKQQATSTSSSTTSPSSSNLEIILVERPLYDVDLLPRFDGGQDWST